MDVSGEPSIGQALERREIVFAYQPVLDLRTGSYLYVEALARWRQPGGKLRMPVDFLHLIDTRSLADQLTELALSQALEALPALRRRFGDELSIGLNLSNLQLLGRAADLAIEAVHSSGISDWLIIEIVEDLVIEDLAAVRAVFARMRDAGIKVMLDDFGTGNATLSFLTDLAYDGLKLDRRYVSGIKNSVPNRALVEALIRYGLEAGVQVIAEGVEDAETCNALDDMRCRYAQGYFCGPPLLLEEIIRPHTLPDQRPDGEASEEPLSLAAGTPSLATIEHVTAKLRRHEPTTTGMTFEEFVAVLDDLEEQALSVDEGAERVDLLIEVRHRRAVAALYFDQVPLVFKWVLELARFCDEHARIGPRAQALSLLVICAGETPEQRHEAANALVRVLQIRDSGGLSLDQMSQLDNNIGVIFSDLGMIEQSRTWWTNSYRRSPGIEPRTMFYTCLNLIEHTLTIYEVPVLPGLDAISEQDLELLDELLEAIDGAPKLPESVHASFRCRRHVLVGDLEAARNAVVDRGTTKPAGILETCHALRADAVLARASNDVAGFLAATSALVDSRPERGLLLLQIRSMDRLRAEALALADRHEEAYTFLQGVLESETRESARSKSRVYAWLQSQVGLDRPFATVPNL